MIKQVCLYCNASVGSIKELGENVARISHGVCPGCFPRFVAGSGKPFEEFLNSLPAPVLVMDQDGRVANANTRGQKLLSRKLGEIQNRLGGEVFNCKHADLPDGCGKTIHCKACTIRMTVISTFESGRPCIKVPAYMDLSDRTGVKTIRFIISTEKVGSIVLLRIDDAQPGE